MKVVKHDLFGPRAVKTPVSVHIVEVNVPIGLLDFLVHFFLGLLSLIDGLLALIDKTAKLRLSWQATQ